MEQDEEKLDPDLGLVSRMVRVFTAPDQTFAAVGRRTSWTDWLVPVLAVVICAVIAAQITMPAIQALQAEMLQQRLKTMSPQEREAAARMSNSGAMAAMVMVGIPVGSFAFLFAGAGILLLVARYGLGGQVSYAQMLAVWAYSSLVNVIAVLVRTPLIVAKKTVMVFIGPGVFLDETAMQSFWGRLVAGLDLFSFWQLFLAAVGVATLTNSATRRALIPLILLWLAWLALSAGLGGLFGASA